MRGRYDVTHRLHVRADNSKSSSSSASSSQKSATTSACKGSSCELPAGNTHQTNTAVIVAVVVPVCLVAIALSIVLYMVWKKGKKEALEDNDPDYDGDGDFFPSMGPHYELKDSFPRGNSSGSNFDGFEPKIPYEYGGVGVPSLGPNSMRTGTPAEAFQLPHGTGREDLREFARSLDANDFSGYRLASRSASELSLTQPSVPMNKVRPAAPLHKKSFTSSNLLSVETSSFSNPSPEKASPANHQFREPSGAAESTGPLRRSASFEFEASPVKDVRTNVEQGYVRSFSGYSPDEPTQESKDDTASIDLDNAPNGVQNPFLPEGFPENEYVGNFNNKEEENIKRMKSIYEVYLDRNGTVVKKKTGDAEISSKHEVPVEDLPADALHQINAMAASNTDAQSPIPAEDKSGIYADASNLRLPADEPPDHRIASSIYSEMPPVTDHSQAIEPQHLEQNQNMQYIPQQPNLTYPQGAYSRQPAFPQHMHMQQQRLHLPQQYYHPQALENIRELPTPSHLPFSATTSSLTSFRGNGNGAINAIMGDGRSANPIDHPELFYNQTSPTQDGFAINHSTQSYSQGSQVLPHHLRQSVVMTNPAELSHSKLYKPAGSFRNYSAANSRNNSMTSQHTMQQHQAQLAHQRVSGILDDHDAYQRPNMSAILPLSGSQDDLRKQLGSSHNYNNV
ncbi:LAMI_0G02542g1_1 [Lachancea mirantina]|uniref:LAMI_0G02542g1_1 n=1 Tax=Lachancea mirantina TaxID=1230905 RepID=A0A1G4K7X5_9SACH|nr:LAMI_0G02542g1_1 [Lachancea mirantina]